MCLGAIVRLGEAWEEDGVRVGRLADGSVVPLAYVPEAQPGALLLIHLGIPVELLEERVAHQAFHLRAEGRSR